MPGLQDDGPMDIRCFRIRTDAEVTPLYQPDTPTGNPHRVLLPPDNQSEEWKLGDRADVSGD